MPVSTVAVDTLFASVTKSRDSKVLVQIVMDHADFAGMFKMV